jgi:branched-chain amino acid transport system substrate-binding protein
MRCDRLAVAAACAVIAAGLAACGDDDDTGGGGDGGGSSDFTMTIGDVESFTGDLGALGAPSNKAVKLAVQQLGEAAGKAGLDTKFKLTSEDTQSDPQAAISAARKAVSSGATCIVGPTSTPDATAMLNSVTKVRKIPMLPTATSTALRDVEDDGTVYRTTPPDSLQAQALVQGVEKALGGADGKTVAIGFQNAPYGEGLSNSFKEAWEAKGGTIQGPVGYDPGQPSYDSEAGKLTEGDPDAYVIADFPDTFGKVAAALLRTGEFDATKLWVSDALAVSPIPKSIPAEALDGAHVTSAGSPSGTKQARTFFDAYEKASGPKEGALIANSFDSTILCGLAAVAAGSNKGEDVAAEIGEIDGPQGKPFTYLDLPAAMKAARSGETIHYVGVSGPIEFDADGDTSSGLYDVSTWKGNKLEQQSQLDVQK